MRLAGRILVIGYGVASAWLVLTTAADGGWGRLPGVVLILAFVGIWLAIGYAVVRYAREIFGPGIHAYRAGWSRALTAGCLLGAILMGTMLPASPWLSLALVPMGVAVGTVWGAAVEAVVTRAPARPSVRVASWLFTSPLHAPAVAIGGALGIGSGLVGLTANPGAGWLTGIVVASAPVVIASAILAPLVHAAPSTPVRVRLVQSIGLAGVFALVYAVGSAANQP